MTAPTTGERLIRVEVIMEEFRKEVREAFSRLERQQEKLDIRLATAEETISTAKVGWKTLLWVGGAIMTISGTIGAMVAQWLPFLSGAPR